MQQSNSEKGRLGEDLTAYYLTKSGYTVTHRNFRVRGGEIDIIAEKDGIAAFVEVKTRSDNSFYTGALAVGARKKALLLRAAAIYMEKRGCMLQPRFDVSDVTLKNGKIIRFKYYDNAFTVDNADFSVNIFDKGDDMFYKSTRDSSVKISAAEAISKGISDDGGLFVPNEIPALTMEEIENIGSLPYAKGAAAVFKKFLTDFSDDELAHCTECAYNGKSFASANITETTKLCNGTYVLELWHGPTCAFKDMALQILPYLLTVSLKKLGSDKKVVILVATSGDTGKAALEGFADVDGTSIMVFYPANGVSLMQKTQMTTQRGGNVSVCAVNGNFDDCQNGVKAIFTDEAVKEKLNAKGMMFSSANSINWGRLAPQIIYYISAYARLMRDGEINKGEKINIVVPTGNFGNILAAFYAKKMGLPVNRLICASNANNVLTDFISTGIYDRNRNFITTVSPSMDILISSNLERLLYILSGENDKLIREWFTALSDTGRYEVTEDVKEKISESFSAGFCDDARTKAVIKEIYDKYSYTLDTHTAVAVAVYEDYKAKTGDNTKTLIASTASPYKFSSAVLEAIEGQVPDCGEFEKVERLHKISGYPVPPSLAQLRDREIRFKESIDRDGMTEYVLRRLNVM